MKNLPDARAAAKPNNACVHCAVSAVNIVSRRVGAGTGSGENEQHKGKRGGWSRQNSIASDLNMPFKLNDYRTPLATPGQLKNTRTATPLSDGRAGGTYKSQTEKIIHTNL